MNLMSESQIISQWSSPKIKVSVVCITYNHERFIREALISFLAQKTDFAFEIVIGEDASTDRTLSIIHEFQSKYPNIIKVISTGINVGINANLKRVIDHCKGEWLAICEGDDYWVDERKLQKQIGELEKNPECDMCFHPAFLKSGTEKINFRKLLAYHSPVNHIVPPEVIISRDGGYCPTASLLIRSNSVKHLPDWFVETAPIGDYFIQAYAALKGGALYLHEPMSVYRVLSAGSWSESMKSLDKKMNFNRKLLLSLEFMREDNLMKYYTVSIDKQLADVCFSTSLLYLMKNDAENFKVNIIRAFTFFQKKSRLKIKIIYYFRNLPNLLRLGVKIIKFLK